MIVGFKFLFFFILSLSTSLAQNMDGDKNQKTAKAPAELSTLLKEDKTDEYVWTRQKFECHNFAATLLLQRSSTIETLEAYDLDSIAIDWGVVIKRTADSCKLPIYYLSLANEEAKFYHAINAVLVNPEKPEELSSYIFIEPQTDEVFLTTDQVYERYEHYFNRDGNRHSLKLKISTLESIKHYSGPDSVLQTRNKMLYSFELK